jgi:integrase/recombinase XerD
MVALRRKKETIMKQNNLQTQRTSEIFSQETDLFTWVEAFLIDRKAQNLSTGTLKFYQNKLKLFLNYCEAQVISDITQINPNYLRQFLLYLEETGHNPGGIHAIYRSIKAFLKWYENEVEIENWKNPINKVKAPKVPIEPLDPVELSDVSTMITTCQKNTFTGERDKAILLALLDTGARAQEFLDMNLDDINLIAGEILIRQGKGRKPRMVYLGKKSRKAVRSYLKKRNDYEKALWVRDDGEGRLSYDGLRAIIVRRSKLASISTPSLHSFRRAFAINMLRSGVNVYSLQALMGHSGLQVLHRYLKQTKEDLQIDHSKGSPVDNNKLL